MIPAHGKTGMQEICESNTDLLIWSQPGFHYPNLLCKAGGWLSMSKQNRHFIFILPENPLGVHKDRLRRNARFGSFLRRQVASLALMLTRNRS